MSETTSPRANRRRKEPRWLWGIVAVLVLFPIVASAGIISFFLPSSGTRALRRGLTESSGVEWEQRVAVNVGGLTFGAVRTGLSFAELEPEVRAALQTVRGAEIAIYSLPSGSTAPDLGHLLESVDSSMDSRGWYRVVGVMHGHDLVTVHVPAKKTSPRSLKCCVVVFTGQQMFVATVRANPEPLINCLLDKPEIRGKLHLLASR